MKECLKKLFETPNVEICMFKNRDAILTESNRLNDIIQ